jgi:hypothetical protein
MYNIDQSSGFCVLLTSYCGLCVMMQCSQVGNYRRFCLGRGGIFTFMCTLELEAVPSWGLNPEDHTATKISGLPSVHVKLATEHDPSPHQCLCADGN